MDRLTERFFNYDANFVASRLQNQTIVQVLKRLQQYEDLFLTPEEIIEQKQKLRKFGDAAADLMIRNARMQGILCDREDEIMRLRDQLAERDAALKKRVDKW